MNPGEFVAQPNSWLGVTLVAVFFFSFQTVIFVSSDGPRDVHVAVGAGTVLRGIGLVLLGTTPRARRNARARIVTKHAKQTTPVAELNELLRNYYTVR